MPIAGLALTLSDDGGLAAAAIADLSSRGEIQLGEMGGRYLAVVADTPDCGSGRDLHRWIESLPGIDYVDVVYVGFDDGDAPARKMARDQSPSTLPA